MLTRPVSASWWWTTTGLGGKAGRVRFAHRDDGNVYGADHGTERNVVEHQIRNLRAQLQDDWRQPRFCATIPGRCHRFLPTLLGDVQERGGRPDALRQSRGLMVYPRS